MSKGPGAVFMIAILAFTIALTGCESGGKSAPSAPPARTAPPEGPTSAVPVGLNSLHDPIRLLQDEIGRAHV